MVKRVLVGGKTFASSALPGQIIKLGDVIEVTQEVADNLDTHTWSDKANSKKPYFVKTTDPLAAPYVAAEVEEEPKPKAVKKKRAPRKTKKA